MHGVWILDFLPTKLRDHDIEFIVWCIVNLYLCEEYEGINVRLAEVVNKERKKLVENMSSR